MVDVIDTRERKKVTKTNKIEICKHRAYFHAVIRQLTTGTKTVFFNDYGEVLFRRINRTVLIRTTFVPGRAGAQRAFSGTF